MGPRENRFGLGLGSCGLSFHSVVTLVQARTAKAEGEDMMLRSTRFGELRDRDDTSAQGHWAAHVEAAGCGSFRWAGRSAAARRLARWGRCPLAAAQTHAHGRLARASAPGIESASR